jgi:hypothetical protein
MKTQNNNSVTNNEIDIGKYVATTIFDMGFTSIQVEEILRFYLFNAPILSIEKKSDRYGFKSLSYYGWEGRNLNIIKNKIFMAAKLSPENIDIVKKESINDELEDKGLYNGKICVDTSKLVIKQNYYEKNMKQKETELQCLFRHVRNSFAHNQTYYFDNENILLEDFEKKDSKQKQISARIIIPKSALLDWMTLIKMKCEN